MRNKSRILSDDIAFNKCKSILEDQNIKTRKDIYNYICDVDRGFQENNIVGKFAFFVGPDNYGRMPFGTTKEEELLFKAYLDRNLK